MSRQLKQFSLKNIFKAVFALMAITTVVAYISVRIYLIVTANYAWPDLTAALALLFAEFFISLQCIGYLVNLIVVSIYDSYNSEELVLNTNSDVYPPVAVVVASYREPLDIVGDTLTCFYNLSYPNKHLYLLDDTKYDSAKSSEDEQELMQYQKDIEELCKQYKINLFRRKWRGAKAGIINDFIAYISNDASEGSFLFRFDGFSEHLSKEKYIAIFDADMNPVPDFLEPLVHILESRPNQGFVQTPQYYTNYSQNRVARASGLQQAVFYEYICESKSICDAMFCCGTNVLFRLNALRDVGGFDESSVTEDFSTALSLRLNGWKSSYLNRVSAFGMGPEDLISFFKQQFRWALGTSGLFRRLFIAFLKHPRSLKPVVWWEYFLSSTYYFVGWAFIVMILAPVGFLIFNIPGEMPNPQLYFTFYAPFMIFSFSAFFASLLSRGYRFRDFLFAVLLIVISSPLYAKASLMGLLGVKGKFAVTPKKGSTAVPLYALWPQLLLAFISFSSVVWGINRLIFEEVEVIPIVLNIFWATYFTIILSSVLYFNFADEAK